MDFFEVTYDKFTFRVRKDCLYHAEECWVREENGLVVVGTTDFLQRVAGDVAFLEAPEPGTELVQGGPAGVMETIKATVNLISPLSGRVEEVNSVLEDNPQLINLDPYGEGWILKVAPSNWEAEKAGLMSAEVYLPLMEEKIKRELEKGK